MSARRLALIAFLVTALATRAFAQTVRIDATPGHAINAFDPDSALGSSIDVLSRTDINKVYTPHIIQEALSAGWGPITYRKSNPYLTSKFTGESDALHAQWVIVDLQAEKPVSAMRIAWASPYATSFQVEYWVGTNALDFDGGPKGEWKVFPSGALKNAQGGTVTLKLRDAPVSTRFVRILMTESSNTCDEHGPGDVRNCVGYAIQLIEAGTLDATGSFVEVTKQPDERRTTYAVSSIDPWHAAADVNDGGAYQHTGFDLFFTSGLTNNLPAMIPVAMLYGTPEDAAAQIAYI